MNPVNYVMVKTIQIMPKKLVRIFANKYIAGDNINDAIAKVKELNANKIVTTIDVLGEAIKDREEAKVSKNESLEVLDAIVKHNLDGNLSVKLTMLGLYFDYDYTKSLFREIMEEAKRKNIFVRIDMEDSPVTDVTIKMYEEMRKDFDNVGLVVQAYLRRAEKDVLKLTEQKANFRLCKGIYVEPEEIAYKGRQEIRDNFMKILRIMLERGAYAGIATHDDYLTKESEKLVSELNLTKDKYEFQMLLGVREWLRDELVAKGNKLRVYVPFGSRWYQYSIRRFKENPNVAGQVIKSMFVK
jgi:proline dehydrogenase